MYSFSYSEKLKKILKKLYKKDKVQYEALMNKINEIVNSYDIEHYKNLKYDLSDKKRVHVMGSFVLVFIYDKKNNAILFEDYDHHDKIYRWWY